MKTRNSSEGYTLVELLVTVGIILILMSLVLAAVKKVHGKARSTACLNNFRQLGYGFQLYTEDNQDTFPAGASAQHYGPHPEDWIWWHNGRDVRKSSLVPYMGEFNADLFRCPADEEALRHPTDVVIEGNPYRYSYSLTSYQNYDEFNPGLATLISRDRKLILPFRTSMVKDPSGQMLLVEEDRRSLDDGRWVPGDFFEKEGKEWRPRSGADPRLVQILTRRHYKRGNVLFLDNHIEAFDHNRGFDLRLSNPFIN